MTDHVPNDLSHLSEEEFNALCPQGEHAPGPEPLSPAALRAAADQVVPSGFEQLGIRYELLRIADELEGND